MALSYGMEAGMKAVDKRIEVLRMHRNSLRKAERYLQKMSDKFNSKLAEEQQLNEEVNELK